ncbi:MAG: putative membrane protein SpoIIM required for sporulation [Parvicella sp.]
MKETTFIDQNKKKWASFEKMSQQSSSDPDEVSRLFVELTDDLSYARTHYPKRSVRVYLNSLAQRVFHDMYKKKREPLSKFFKFWTTDLPLQMYKSRWMVLAAFIIFIVGAAIGVVSTQDDPDFLGAVIGYEYVDMAEAFIEDGKPMSVYGQSLESTMFNDIALNNMKVALYAFILGALFCIGSAIFLFSNAIMVGAFQWFYVVRGLATTSFLTIWIHGAFEIPAIILASAAGMTMGAGFMFPGTLTRGQAFVNSAKSGVKIMIGLVPVILAAAFIESYATRHTIITTKGEALANEWPDSLKWLFIIVCFAIILLYFVIYPFFVAKKYNYNIETTQNPQYIDRKPISLLKIKDLGEIFTDTFGSLRKIFGLYSVLFLITIPLNIVYIYMLMEQHHFSDYSLNQLGEKPLPIIIRNYFEHYEYVFIWTKYFVWDLFLFQTFVFALNAFFILYSFKIFVAKTANKTFKSFYTLFFKSFWILFIGCALLGLIACFVNIGLSLLITALSPFLFMWMLPSVIWDQKIGKAISYGFKMPWKSFGNGIALFFAMIASLFLISLAILPANILVDMVLKWFVAPIADNPEYIYTFVDACILLVIAHLIFPIFFIAFSILYYSNLEQEEANGMYERLEAFGKRSKIYESADNAKF